LNAAGSSFPIVGIGASAGGLKALEIFLQNVSLGCGVAFVIVQHLDLTHKDMMVELLQRVTPIPVVQIGNHLKFELDHLYIIPRNKDIILLHGVLYLLDPAVAPKGHDALTRYKGYLSPHKPLPSTAKTLISCYAIVSLLVYDVFPFLWGNHKRPLDKRGFLFVVTSRCGSIDQRLFRFIPLIEIVSVLFSSLFRVVVCSKLNLPLTDSQSVAPSGSHFFSVT